MKIELSKIVIKNTAYIKFMKIQSQSDQVKIYGVQD